MLQGVAGIVCRKKLPERPNGDGTEATATVSGASVQSAQASSSNACIDSQPAVGVADSSGAVDSSHASLSVVPDQSQGQNVDTVTDRLADLELSGGLHHRRRNGQRQDVQDAVAGRDRRQRDDELNEHRN